MYRFIGEQSTYTLFNVMGFLACMISSLFYFKSKQNVKSLCSKYAIYFASNKSMRLGKIIEIILLSFESLLMAYMVDVALVNFNKPFGALVGTGANYFGGLFAIPLLWFILCIIFIVNPLKQIDIATMGLPAHLFFVKLACFSNGCCWGIPWEYGPYNHHPDHPGNQVPVQAIESFWALAILVFLLIYRKKAKPGTIFPIYMILYSATRFCSEFFRREENVLWIFKRYHLLCLAGIVVGLILLLIVKVFGERITELFEKPHKNFELKIAQFEKQKALELAEAAKDKLEKIEKAKLAREKAKARRRK